MSVYNARRAPNVSQYVEDLNQIPSSFDGPPSGNEEFDFEGSLAMFTNAEFPDFDAGNPRNDSIPFDPSLEEPPNKDGTDTTLPDDLNAFSIFNSDLNLPTFAEFSQFPNSIIQPAISQGYPANIQSPTTSSPHSQSPPGHQVYPHGQKRKATDPHAHNPVGSLEDQSRLAAEEDKRRRNTAASARFRVKKKEREKALERSVKDVTDKNSKLEQKVGQLEMENRWLRNLITEKNGSKNDIDITEMWQKFRRESEERDKMGKDQTDGIGTSMEVKSE